MNDAATWQRTNSEEPGSGDDVAAAATRSSSRAPTDPSPPETSLLTPRSRGWFERQRQDADVPVPLRSVVGGADIDQAAEVMATAAAADPPPALVILSQRMGLVTFEQEILLLCAAMELDTRMAALCAAAQGEPSRAYPTFALALSLFDPSRLGGAVAGETAPPLAPHRHQSAGRAAAHRQRTQSRRTCRQLPEGAELPRRPADAVALAAT